MDVVKLPEDCTLVPKQVAVGIVCFVICVCVFFLFDLVQLVG